MTNSFQSTAFQSSTNPVDTFVQPVTVQPKSGAEELTEILATVNPSLQKFLGTKIGEAIDLDEARGQELVLNASQEELKSIVSAVQKKDGNEAARQLLGSSMFVRRGVEKQLAINLGSTASSNAKLFFNGYTVDKELNDGSIVKVPLIQFPINSPEFNNAVAEYQVYSKKNVDGIRPLYVNDYFIPQQSKAIQDYFAEHIKKNNEYNLQIYEGQLKSTMLLNFNKIDEIGTEEAFTNIQNNIKEIESYGLTTVVSPTNLLKTVNAQASNIFLINNKNGEDGFGAVDEYLDFVGNLKVGPEQILKDGTTKQSLLKDFYNEDTVKLYTNIINANEKINQQKQLKFQQAEEFTIKEMIKRHSFVQVNPDTKEVNYEVVESLVKAFPDRFEFIEGLIEEQDISRDEFYTKFKFDLIGNKYTFDQAFNVLKNFEESLGVSITGEDETELEKLFTLAKELEGKDVLSDYRKQIDNVLIESKIILGGEGEFYNSFSKDFYTSGKQLDYIDAKDNFDKKILEIFSTTELKPGYKTLAEQHSTEFKEARINFLADVKEINERKGGESIYQQSGIISEVDKELEERKKERGEAFTTVDSSTFDVLSKSNAFEKITVDGRKAIKNKENGQIYVFDNEVTFGSIENKSNEKKSFKELMNKKDPSVFADVSEEESPTTVEVRKGDTLFNLADLFSTTIKAIKKANNLDSDLIIPGQELIMPIVNAIGDAVVPESDLKNRSVLEEIDVTKPFSYDSLYRLALEVGFPPEDAKIMAAIALAESKGDAQIDTVKSGTDPNKEGEFSLGLWQINVIKEYQAERFPLFNIKSPQELYDPLTNAKAAFILYDRRKPEERFNDWSTYTDGTYKDFLPKTN